MGIFEEAEQYFKDRMKEHKKLYEKHAVRLLKKRRFNDHEKKTLDMSILYHDNTKYSKDEREGYIWLTWKYRSSENFIPEDKMKIVEKAVKTHRSINRHHPEFFTDLNRMLRMDIAQMVCDHAAICEEVDEPLIHYTNNLTTVKYKWNDYQKYLIFDYVLQLSDRD